MKTVAQLIEEHRGKETQLITDYIKSVGGDGLVCIGECGCGLDGLIPCGLESDELNECYPAKGKMGEWEGMPSMVYYKVEVPG